MSKHSLKYNINQRKFSLKFIVYLFILIDVMLFFSIPSAIYLQLLGWELFTFLGLLIGMRGQVRYKELVYDLIAIRQDPQYNDAEDLRGFRLARHIDHACIEWDLWYQEQQHKSNKNNNKKIIINKEEKTMSIIVWDEVVMKQFGYMIIGLWELFFPVVAFFLEGLNFHIVWIVFITGAWMIFGLFVWFYLHYIFKLDPEERTLYPKITDPEIAELIK